MGLGAGASIATQAVTVACYVRGTSHRRRSGEVAVETLRIGDLGHDLSGALRALKWIGTRAYSARFAGSNPELLPIRFKAGSLADNIPARDLLVSPKHAMFLDGILIPAEHLVNGATIVQEPPGEDIHYFHLELESHDVLIAEGALSESFVDDDSRAMFQNAQEFRALYPEERQNEAALLRAAGRRRLCPRPVASASCRARRAWLSRRDGLWHAAGRGRTLRPRGRFGLGAQRAPSPRRRPASM